MLSFLLIEQEEIQIYDLDNIDKIYKFKQQAKCEGNRKNEDKNK